jgi:hypothetical protein
MKFVVAAVMVDKILFVYEPSSKATSYADTQKFK